MDLIVSGGGGAPLYPYTGEPDIDGYLKGNEAINVKVEHLVKPGAEGALSPYHFLIVRVDGNRLDIQVVGVDSELLTWYTGNLSAFCFKMADARPRNAFEVEYRETSFWSCSAPRRVIRRLVTDGANSAEQG